jgi:hypothetical protein
MGGRHGRTPLEAKEKERLLRGVEHPGLSGPFNRTGPHPNLMLVGWCSEPDPDGPLSPGDGMGLHEFLDPVLPQDPGVHRMWGGRGGHRQLAHLLRLEAAGLPLGKAWTFGHSIRV